MLLLLFFHILYSFVLLVQRSSFFPGLSGALFGGGVDAALSQVFSLVPAESENPPPDLFPGDPLTTAPQVV